MSEVGIHVLIETPSLNTPQQGRLSLANTMAEANIFKLIAYPVIGHISTIMLYSYQTEPQTIGCLNLTLNCHIYQ